MTVFKRGKFYHFRFMLEGELYHGSTGETAKTPAQEYETDYRRGLRDGSIRPGMEMPTLGEFLDRYEVSVEKSEELSPKSKEGYIYGCNLLRQHKALMAMQVGDITTSTAASLKWSGSGSKANQALRQLRRLLGIAEEHKIISGAPTINLRDENERITIIDPWLEALLLEFASPSLHVVLVVMFDCGMRPEEVGRMRWEDLRWLDNTAAVQRGKTANARRLVPFTQRMKDTLSAWRQRTERLAKKAGRPEDSLWVFPSLRAKTGHLGNFTQMWARTIKRVLVAIRLRSRPPLPPDVVLYSARHTFATTYLRNSEDRGGAVVQLMRIMGHSDIKTTMRYLHLVEAEGAAAVMNKHNESKKLILLRKEA